MSESPSSTLTTAPVLVFCFEGRLVVFWIPNEAEEAPRPRDFADPLPLIPVNAILGEERQSLLSKEFVECERGDCFEQQHEIRADLFNIQC